MRTHGIEATYRWCFEDNGRACAACRRAHAERNVRDTVSRARRIREDPSLATHGKAATYANWGCRCDPCTDAAASSHAAWRRAAGVVRRTGLPAPQRRRRSRIEPIGREWLQ